MLTAKIITIASNADVIPLWNMAPPILNISSDCFLESHAVNGPEGEAYYLKCYL
jgi:hypothetical protein